MKAICILLAAILLSFTSMGCGRKYTKVDKFDKKLSASGKTSLSIDNVSGTVKVVRSETDSIISIAADKEVQVRKKDLSKPFDEIEIILDTIGSEVHLKTQYNKDLTGGLFKEGSGSRVNYTITVPANLKIKVENVSGNVVLQNLAGDLDISLISGDVDLQNTSGKLNIDLTNGDITGAVDSSKGMDISVINGDTKLNLNDLIPVKIKADVANGKISYEDMKFDTKFEEKKSFRGTIGNGSVEISIDIVNGRIKLYGKKSNLI